MLNVNKHGASVFYVCTWYVVMFIFLFTTTGLWIVCEMKPEKEKKIIKMSFSQHVYVSFGTFVFLHYFQL